jgi:hypothetical protein
MDKNVKSGWDAISRERRGETNDCAVVALALATDLPYDTVHAAMKANGRGDRKGTNRDTTLRTVKDLGFEALEISPKQIIVEYPGRHIDLQNVTVKHLERFAEKLAWMKGRNFLFSTGTHMLAVVDGKVQDWTEGRPFRVKFIWEIVRSELVRRGNYPNERNLDLGERMIGNLPNKKRVPDGIEFNGKSPWLWTKRDWVRAVIIERVLTVMRFSGKEVDIPSMREELYNASDSMLYYKARKFSRRYLHLARSYRWRGGGGNKEGLVMNEKQQCQSGFVPITMDNCDWVEQVLRTS